MKVVSFKVDLRTYQAIVEAAGDESVAAFLKRVVLEFIGRPTDKGIEGRPTNDRVVGRPMVDAYHRNEPIKIPELKEPRAGSHVIGGDEGISPMKVEIDPEKLRKFKEKWGR